MSADETYRDPEWLSSMLAAGLTVAEVAEECGVTPQTVADWRQRLGVEPAPEHGPEPVDREECLRDVMRVARELGRVPSDAEYIVHGRHHPDTLRVKYDGWHEARRRAAERLGWWER